MVIFIRSTRYYSKRQEKKGAEILKKGGGEVTSNSGATIIDKGDIKAKYILVDGKTSKTPKKSFTVKKEELEKIKMEAFSRGKLLSAIQFDFGDNEEQFFILNEKDFKMLYEAYLEVNEGG